VVLHALRVRPVKANNPSPVGHQGLLGFYAENVALPALVNRTNQGDAYWSQSGTSASLRSCKAG
jgi:hypothetical protein